MLLHVNPSSGVPVYLQIAGQIKHAVAAGALKQGDALPSVRKLASDLRVNPNTVAKAYQDLEHEGVIRTVPGGGTYVAEDGVGLTKLEKLRRLRPLAEQIAVESSHLRLDEDEVIRLIEEALKQFGGKR
jgi:GntR family transcriptional regulator